jgi:hypothetical protein
VPLVANRTGSKPGFNAFSHERAYCQDIHVVDIGTGVVRLVKTFRYTPIAAGRSAGIYVAGSPQEIQANIDRIQRHVHVNMG